MADLIDGYCRLVSSVTRSFIVRVHKGMLNSYIVLYFDVPLSLCFQCCCGSNKRGGECVVVKHIAQKQMPFNADDSPVLVPMNNNQPVHFFYK